MVETTENCPLCIRQRESGNEECKYCGIRLDCGPVDSFDAEHAGGTQPDGKDGGHDSEGPLSPGDMVREYQIVRQLGEGGMGVVYLATHELTGQHVAIKLIWPELIRNPGIRARFIEEARVLGQLVHPNIVTLHNFFEEDGQLCLIMAFIEGRTLEEVLRAHRLSVDEALEIAIVVLIALEYAHTRPEPVVHRDIKPANIILADDGRIVVTDFGVARVLGRKRLTKHDNAVGTYEFMSPELVQGKEVGPQADIYALGITLYKTVTGVVPFPQMTATGINCMTAHLKSPVPPMTDHRQDIPRWFLEIVNKALDKNPDARFASAAAMKAALMNSDSTAAPRRGVGSHESRITKAGTTKSGERLRTRPTIKVLSDMKLFLTTALVGRWLTAVQATAIAAIIILWAIFGVGSNEGDEGPPVKVNWNRAPGNSAGVRTTDTSLKADTEGLPYAIPADMMLVPEGEFLRGSSSGTGGQDQRPQRKVLLSTYYVDRTKTSREAYQGCVDQGECSPAQCALEGQTPDRYPVVCVSSEQAQAYCRSVDKRLCTEAEWEKAARGTNGRLLPWDGELECRYGHFGNADAALQCPDHPFAVDEFVEGASPYGVLDMVGVVGEWVADWYDESYYAHCPPADPPGPDQGEVRVVRGGCPAGQEGDDRFSSTKRCASYSPDYDSLRNGAVGFRCCKSARQVIQDDTGGSPK